MSDIKLFVALRAFVVNGKGQVLIVRESGDYEDGTNNGKWDVVGGRLDPGEQWQQGLLREAKEETGLDVEVGQPFYVDEWRPVVRDEQWHIVGTFFVCKALGDEVTLSQDHDKFEWIDPKNYELFNLMGVLPGAFDSFLNR
jgi:8-oxo-dGTP diphosphatase